MWKEVPESKLLVEQLCSVDRYKRLDGVVNELAFEMHLYKSILRDDDEIAFGWCAENRYGKPMDYYKVVSLDTGLCDADVEFLRRREDGHVRFFYVVLDDQQTPSVANLKFSVCSVRLIGGEIAVHSDLQSEQKLGELLAAGCGAESHQGLTHKEREEKSSLVSFLSSFDPVVLKRIVLKRIFLNFYLRYATDIDAVLYNRCKKEIELIEFKRKTPIPGLWFNVSGEKISKFGIENVQKLQRKLKVRGNAGQNEIKACLQSALVNVFGPGNVVPVVNNEENRTRWTDAKFVAQDCVGLDLSHSRNVVLAERYNMRYRYVLLLEDVVDPKFYFESDYSLKPGISLKERYVVLKSARGFTYTVGNDSGSYTKSIRVQLVWKV